MFREEYGDLFNYPGAKSIVITTNKIVKTNGDLVMGAGVAKAAAQKFPWLPATLGHYRKTGGTQVTTHYVTDVCAQLITDGLPSSLGWNPEGGTCVEKNFHVHARIFNNVGGLPELDRGTLVPYHLISLPTKNDWRYPSDIKLIEAGCESLVTNISTDLVPFYSPIIMTRPGCGNGGLNWEDVRKVIGPILTTSLAEFIVVRPRSLGISRFEALGE